MPAEPAAPSDAEPPRVPAAVFFVTRLMAALAGGCIAAMAVLTVLAVVMRYGVGAPFRFTEDLAGLLLICSVFLSIPHAFSTGSHIRVTLLADRARGPARRVLWIAGQAVFVAFAIAFIHAGWKEAAFTIRLDLKSEIARLPLAPFVLLMLGGVGVAGAVAAWQALMPPPQAPSRGEAH
jgi:TRAP-type C4-dicarboxylate transport system permease small subunit